MKILIINPNTDLKMTETIEKNAKEFVQGDYEVVCKSIDNGPKFIETYEDIALVSSGMTKLLRENENIFDAFVVGCHYDPNLDLMKEITSKPVVGIAEASIKIASMLGHSFSILSTNDHSRPIKEDLVRKYYMKDLLASVRIVELNPEAEGDINQYIKVANTAIKEDKAEVIILGCAGLTGIDKEIQNALNIPVLDGIKCALIIASGLAKLCTSTSKVKKYNPNC